MDGSLDDRLAPLREEIQQTGRLPSRLRKTGAVVGTLAAPAMLLAGLLAWAGSAALSELWLPLGIIGLFGLLVGLFVGVPVSIAFLKGHRRVLRNRLSALPREQQLAVLLPFQDARGDTRRLVALLLRELGTATELLPAAAPSGRGDEASPT
jgi:hypothetical protein